MKFSVVEILVSLSLCKTRSEAIRKVREGAVKVNGLLILSEADVFDLSEEFTVGRQSRKAEIRLGRVVLTEEMLI